jgi:hypothetical protein
MQSRRSGVCTYVDRADQCQLPHDIAKLNPIIRHPRYKTQVCLTVDGAASQLPHHALVEKEASIRHL